MGGDGFYRIPGLPAIKVKQGITEVMEYRAAAAATAGPDGTLSSSITPRITLFPPGFGARPMTTVSALRHQEQHALGGGHLAENALLDRQVKPGIVRVRNKQA